MERTPHDTPLWRAYDRSVERSATLILGLDPRTLCGRCTARFIHDDVYEMVVQLDAG